MDTSNLACLDNAAYTVDQLNLKSLPHPELLSYQRNICHNLIPSIIGLYNLINYPPQFLPPKPLYTKALNKNLKHIMGQIENAKLLNSFYLKEKTLNPETIAIGSLIGSAIQTATHWSYKDTVEWVVKVPPELHRWISVDVPFFLPHLTTMFERLIILCDQERLVVDIKALREDDVSIEYGITIHCAGKIKNHPASDMPGTYLRKFEHHENSFESLQEFLNVFQGKAVMNPSQSADPWITMSFILPKTHRPPRAFSWPAHQTKPNILIVDDNEERAEALCMALQGFEVTARPSGDVDLMVERARKEGAPYDVVFMEKDLTGALPTETIQNIKFASKNHPVLVITMAARLSIPEYNMLKMYRTQVILEKPIRMHALPEVLHEHWSHFLEHKDEPIPFESVPSDIQLLLVENHEPTQFIMVNLLTELGYQVDVASSGYEALGKTDKKMYDFIFMDIGMDGMDGFETTRAIRTQASQVNADTPVVALTAYTLDNKEDKAKVRDSALNGVLVKPASLEAIQETILALLPEERFCLVKDKR